jgi:membrane-bound lytic murein transglycosylase B
VFREIDAFQTLKNALNSSFTQMAALRDDLSARKSALEDKQTEAQQVRTAQVIAKQAVQDDEKQKQNILTTTKGQEAAYQDLIANKQQQAAAIRAALFGLRDSGAIPFGTAYQYAKEASAKTGVSPALILAILTQESDLGTNTGSCLVTNLSTGNGKGKNTGTPFANVMKAPRDTDPFQTITAALGRDWPTTPVSCPQSTGYGGAMGPAQFIPSTWMLYKDRLSRVTGEDMPDPWNARTAIFATALYMSDMGADAGTRTAERNAACKYFSGRTCSGSISVYGDSVMELRDDIQGQIDIING